MIAQVQPFFSHSEMSASEFIASRTSSGGTEADCRDFATETITTIQAEVSSQQSLLDAVDSGTSCASQGQSLVSTEQGNLATAQSNLATATHAAADALTAKTTACTASVPLVVNLDTLETNTCYNSEAAFITAKAACDSAIADLATANANVAVTQTAVGDAQTALNSAISEAARLASECNCRVQHEQAAAWTAAQAATASHAADWKQAHEILCALDQNAAAGSGQDECEVPTLNEVTNQHWAMVWLRILAQLLLRSMLPEERPCGLRAAPIPGKAEWKYSTEDHGAPCVTTAGATKMLKSSAGSLGSTE